MPTKNTVSQLIARLSLNEKLALLAGANFWETKSIPQSNLRAVTLNDGPFGLRKPNFLNTGAIGHETIPATSFPTTSLLSSTFNAPLLNEMGVALGKECRELNVDILLGPGINIKRSQLCGRNFEYFSEDPLLTSVLATSLVSGIESTGAGACIKHFAANNQENMRFTTNAIIDPRALNEIYLKPFKTVIKSTSPRAVMCSYNYLNGVKVSESKALLTDKLRDEFKFSGLLMSDWGAVTNIVQSLEAGLNLEMPGGNFDAQTINAALKSNQLTEQKINEAITPLISLMVKLKKEPLNKEECDYDTHFKLAVKIAEDGAVLLKNSESILPLNKTQKIALIGNFAKNPRFQGLGSSRVTPTKVSALLNEFQKSDINFTYADGYYENEIFPNETLINEACEIAKDADIVILNVGLPEPYEVEGTDRVTLNLPPSHNELIRRISLVNKKIVILLNAGSSVVMPWIDDVKAVLQMHLPGSAGAIAAFNLLFGKSNPSGKLAETYPLNTQDTPTANTFWQSKRNVFYLESIYVGYRYYEKVGQKVLFPFGYGLSYTKFIVTNEKVYYDQVTKCFTVTCQIKNSGDFDGAEVLQLYVGKKNSVTFNPPKELRSFIKVFLKEGEEKSVTLKINEDELMFFDPLTNKWQLEQTTYIFSLGNSSSDAKVIGEYCLKTGNKLTHYQNYEKIIPTYFDGKLLKNIDEQDLTQYKVLFQHELPLLEKSHQLPYTNEVSLNDVKHLEVAQKIIRDIETADFSLFKLDKEAENFFKSNFMNLPIRSFVELTNRMFTYDHVHGIVLLLNCEEEAAQKLFKKHGKILIK